MILENLNGSSAIRTEYTGHKTKGKHILRESLVFCELQLSFGLTDLSGFVPVKTCRWSVAFPVRT